MLSTFPGKCVCLHIQGRNLWFCRMFPPTTPDQKHPRGFLYQLFRPEFVINYKKAEQSYPLSSDAFTTFAAKDPKYRELNNDVREATDYLFTKVIPKFAEWLTWFHTKPLLNVRENLHHHMHKLG